MSISFYIDRYNVLGQTLYQQKLYTASRRSK